MKSWRVVLMLVSLVLVLPVAAWADCSDYPDPYYEDINGDGIDGDASMAIFVSLVGNDVTGLGTMASPVRTIARGINLAIANGKKQVYVAGGGTYNEAVTMADGISLYGQYGGPPSWGRSNLNLTTINGSGGMAVFAQNLTMETHLEGFRILSSGGFTNYAVRVVNGTGQLYIRYNSIQPGPGLNGSLGISGPSGPNGGPGVAGSGGGSGGPGGTSACGRTGGIGGSGVAPGGTGIGGTPGGSPGFCSLGGSGDGGNGAFGLNGSPGNNGFGGSSYSFVGGLFLAMNGNAGTNGNHGNGGGGGGGTASATDFFCTNCSALGGGGGGAGGCGGIGAQGGQGGGGSIGILVFNGSTVIDGNTITTGAGGQGGAGGTGGNGGSGGPGGAGASRSGCATRFAGNGGNGGNGGLGGHGGGGAGGASIGILISSAELVRVGSTNGFAIGPGGAGGFSPAFTGAAGASASVVGSGITSTPSISTVAPGSGSPGTPVTISGSDFDPTPANNEVCFGLGPAAVGAASTSSLDVTVPGSATQGHIKVTVNLLETYSPNVFTISSACAAAKGDMNGEGGLTPADAVLMLSCVFLATGSCDLCFADVNCMDGLSPADVVIELNMVFLGAAPGC